MLSAKNEAGKFTAESQLNVKNVRNMESIFQAFIYQYINSSWFKKPTSGNLKERKTKKNVIGQTKLVKEN